MLIAIVITLLTACALVVLIAVGVLSGWPAPPVPVVVTVAAGQPPALRALVPPRAPPSFV